MWVSLGETPLPATLAGKKVASILSEGDLRMCLLNAHFKARFPWGWGGANGFYQCLHLCHCKESTQNAEDIAVSSSGMYRLVFA